MSEIVHVYPLRPNCRAQFIVPDDLTSQEVERIKAFVMSLVVPDDNEQKERAKADYQDDERQNSNDTR